ncbi:UNKNOWN [Stylonychia lemnae]|uniref:Uncharacterized protein n=1 Tax=Stylonychia lemnae TaxID=5949 RepID=A0A078AJV3_STYLE|nr:UNKNOWN [Stylonychia lemnae]|eukprot:CDW82665.1 UNKNOWN [Stylonychia lemnae]
MNTQRHQFASSNDHHQKNSRSHTKETCCCCVSIMHAPLAVGIIDLLILVSKIINVVEFQKGGQKGPLIGEILALVLVCIPRVAAFVLYRTRRKDVKAVSIQLQTRFITFFLLLIEVIVVSFLIVQIDETGMNEDVYIATKAASSILQVLYLIPNGIGLILDLYYTNSIRRYRLQIQSTDLKKPFNHV